MTRFFLQWFLISTVLAVTANAQVTPSRDAMQNHTAKIISTRQNQFFIPFEVSSSLRKEILEVELVYSTDQGENWYSYQKTNPELKRFQFFAKNDGEYWFIFRLILHNGEVKLAQTTIPSTRVLVDTASPQIQLDTKRGNANEIVINWQVEDVALAGNVPEIYLSYDLNVTWIRLAVDEKKVEKRGNRISGQTVFYPPQGTKSIDIRCEMADVAGNREITMTKIDFSKMEDMHSGLNNPLTGTGENHLPISVLPPRPNLKSEHSHSSGDLSSQGILSDLNLAIESSTPRNAESLPRYASNMSDLSSGGQTEKTNTDSDLKLPFLDLNLSGNGLSPSSPAFVSTEPTSPPPISDSETETTIPDESPLAPKSPSNPDQSQNPKDEPEPLFPGKIVLISIRQSTLPVLIIRWHAGNEAEFKESVVDLYRSETQQGPWTPIAFELPNTGEYLWNISEAEFMPFYLRVDLRSLKGLYTDFTSREIDLMNVVKPK